MTRMSVARLNRSFAMLIALALASIACAWWGGGSAFAAVAILAIGTVKARLVILDFMGLRQAGGPVRFALIAWPVFFALAALSRLALSTF